MPKIRIFLLALAVAGLAAVPAASAQAPAAGAAGKCPQFRVLHNDTISGVKFPAGPYNMVTSLMSCTQSTTYFQQFLAAGRVPSGWKVAIIPGTQKRRFTKLGTKVDFQATPATESAPGPGATGAFSCPGTFHVLHNDRIGRMSLPAGRYQITLLSSQVQVTGLTCQVASNDFAIFLRQDWSGALPSPWYANSSTKTFYRGSPDVGFRVRRVGRNAELLRASPKKVAYTG